MQSCPKNQVGTFKFFRLVYLLLNTLGVAV